MRRTRLLTYCFPLHPQRRGVFAPLVGALVFKTPRVVFGILCPFPRNAANLIRSRQFRHCPCCRGRCQTLEILREVFQKKGNSIREIIGRCSNLKEKQILKLRSLLDAVKNTARQPRLAELLCGPAGAVRIAGYRRTEMVAQGINSRTPPRQATRQQSLLGPDLPSTIEVAGPDVPCDVIAIVRRRDGGTRSWCRAHRADATAKGGTLARNCCAADPVPIRTEEIQPLDLNKYLSGVALWGAVPAVYDTTRLPMDRSIHVHARLTPESEKEVNFGSS